MNNEKPTWELADIPKSIRDVGKLGYAALQAMIARWDEKYANAINTDEDEAA